MTRFWTRLAQPFRKEKKNKKKLPIIVFDEYSKPPSSLKQSNMYSRHLVRIDLLEKAYSHLLINQQNKSYWKLMDPFVQIWYTELDRVCQQSQIALANLKIQLDDLSIILCAVVSFFFFFFPFLDLK